MPRWIIRYPRSSCSSRYLARRCTAWMRWPRAHSASFGSTRQRSRGSCTVRRVISLPATCGAMPRTVVSTSGSSGIEPEACHGRGVTSVVAKCKKPARWRVLRGLSKYLEQARLLDLGFLVRDVLAHDRIVLLRLELLGMKTLVLHRNVEVAGVRGRQQFDLLAHDSSFRPRRRRRASWRPRRRCHSSRWC